ncbi:tetratricopeptide repeat protein [Candidatus Poribacteria bacterium]|nr:tetratricopeptide repeat protein [Candidatus Poribacteria bacterium]
MQLGHIYQETEQLTQAVEAFATITKIYPKNAKAYHELGVCYTKQGTYREAVKAFQRALHLNPEAVETQNLLQVAQARAARQ